MISRDTWIEVIRDYQELKIPELVARELNIDLNVNLKRAISLIGPRRTGKTYYFYQKIKELMSIGISRDRIVYINLEDFRIEDATLADLKNFLDIYFEMYPKNKKKKIWLFLDEIQNVRDWEKFVRTILDKENINIFLTGSSSKLLSKKIETQMRGRSLTYTLFPFSFKEFLTARKINYSQYLSSAEKYEILHQLEEYLKIGGYPEVVLYPSKKNIILRDIVDVTIYRDIVDRWNVRNLKALRLLIKALIHSKEFSVNRFHKYLKTLGINIGKNTLYEYLDHLQDANFVFLLRKYSTTYREQEQSIPKVYIVDNGILTSYGVTSRARLLENLVFLELKRRLHYGDISGNLYYYKINNLEVDFLIKNSEKEISLIQVTYDVSDINTKQREVNSLIKASKTLETKDLYVITWNYEGEEIHNVVTQKNT